MPDTPLIIRPRSWEYERSRVREAEKGPGKDTFKSLLAGNHNYIFAGYSPQWGAEIVNLSEIYVGMFAPDRNTIIDFLYNFTVSLFLMPDDFQRILPLIFMLNTVEPSENQIKFSKHYRKVEMPGHLFTNSEFPDLLKSYFKLPNHRYCTELAEDYLFKFFGYRKEEVINANFI